MTVCEKYSLISESQFEFRQYIWTTNLLELFSDTLNDALDNNGRVLLLYQELSETFDTIDHHMMLSKLSAMSFRGSFIDFLKNYFAVAGFRQLE